MPSVSKKQQKFFQLVKAVQNGKVKKKDVSKSIIDAAKNMTKTQVSHFADHMSKKKRVKRVNEMVVEKLKINPIDINDFDSIDFKNKKYFEQTNQYKLSDSQITETIICKFVKNNLQLTIKDQVDDLKTTLNVNLQYDKILLLIDYVKKRDGELNVENSKINIVELLEKQGIKIVLHQGQDYIGASTSFSMLNIQINNFIKYLETNLNIIK